MRLLAKIVAASALALACGHQQMDYSVGLARAEELVAAGELGEAYALYDRLRALYPGQREPLSRLAWTADRLGEPERAIPVIEERVAQGGAEVHVYHDLLGQLLQRAGRWSEAEAQFRAALELAPSYASGYLRLGMLFGETGRSAEALELARRAVTEIPEDPQMRLFLGRVAMRHRLWDEAARQFEQALELSEPELFYARYGLGLTHLAFGRLLDARRELEVAVELRSDSYEAWYQLANVCERLGDDEARDRALARFEPIYRAAVSEEAAAEARAREAG
jgi:tetratricopeptide (TPR) repeat protein